MNKQNTLACAIEELGAIRSELELERSNAIARGEHQTGVNLRSAGDHIKQATRRLQSCREGDPAVSSGGAPAEL